jgi:hypothetical protein
LDSKQGKETEKQREREKEREKNEEEKAAESMSVVLKLINDDEFGRLPLARLAERKGNKQVACAHPRVHNSGRRSFLACHMGASKCGE